MKNKGKVENIFDEKLEKTIQSKIDEEYSADEDVKNRIREKLEARINSNDERYENSMDDEVEKISTYREDLNSNKIEKNNNVLDLSKKRYKHSKTKKRKLMTASVAAFALVIGLGSSLTIGKDFFTVTKEYHSGKLTVIQEELDVDPSEIEMTLPKELDGKVFDKDGKPIKKINGAMKVLYDESGEKIEKLPIDGDGNYKEEKDTVEYINYKTAEDAEKVLAFKPKVIDGFNIDKIELMKDKKTGKISKEYATVYQSRGKDMITISERIASEENAYVSGGDNIKYVDIQGCKGILSNSYNVDVDMGDLFLSINAKYSHYRNDELVSLSQKLK